MSRNQSTSTVSRSAAQDLIEICRSLGFLSDQNLQQLGLDNPTVEDATSRVPESVLISLWQTISAHDNERGLGLKIGQTINPNAKGLLASWVSQATNLREALTIFRNNILLMNPSESWEVIEDKAAATLIFDLRKELGYPDIAIERSMSAMVTWARALSGQSFNVERADFAFPAPPYIEQFHTIFGENIAFDCHQNQLVLCLEILDLPVVSNNPFLKDIIQAKAARDIAEISNTLPLQEKVKELILAAIASGRILNINEVSETLAMSRQTLYRQLKEEDTDFQSILDSVRKEETLKRLEKGQSITTISLNMGYKDNSSFYKAFNRWFSTSPKNYLQKKKP